VVKDCTRFVEEIHYYITIIIIIIVFTYAEEEGYVNYVFHVSACLSAGLLKDYKRILIKFYQRATSGPVTSHSDVGGNIVQDSNPRTFKG